MGTAFPPEITPVLRAYIRPSLECRKLRSRLCYTVRLFCGDLMVHMTWRLSKRVSSSRSLLLRQTWLLSCKTNVTKLNSMSFSMFTFGLFASHDVTFVSITTRCTCWKVRECLLSRCSLLQPDASESRWCSVNATCAVADLEGRRAGSAPLPFGRRTDAFTYGHIANAKFWSLYCKTWYSEYSKWLPPVNFWQL